MDTDEKKDTLISLLSELENADNGLIEFDPEAHRETLLKTEIKIDSYKYIMTKYESRIAEIAAELKELTEIKRSLERKSDNLKAMIVWVFKQKGLEKFPGVKFMAQMISKSKTVINVEPDAKLYLQYPELIKREYSWDKRAFDLYYKGNPELQELAKVEKTEYIKFTLRKGIEND